jgi:ABC-type multidrug transport system ATPase subunit
MGVLTVDDVSRHFGRRRAVSHVTFEVRAGEILGLLGPNGAGKSTMLAMLATLLRPSSGRIDYGDLAGGGSRGQEPPDAAVLRARIGVLGHDLFLYPELTAFENLAFFAGLYDIADREAAASAALEQAGLADRGADAVSTFSRGMRQRVALERALIHRPALVLLDEPFTGLDDASAAALLRRLNTIKAQGALVIVATHDLDLAEGLLDHAVFLRDGRMAESLVKPQGLRSTYRSVMAGSSSPRAVR